MIKLDSKPENRVVLLTVSMVALAGLIVGIASHLHTQRLVSSYNDAMQTELRQKGLAYGQATQSLLNLFASTSPEAFQQLLAKAAADPGGVLASPYKSDERGDFENPPMGYEVWLQDATAAGGYTLLFRRDNPAGRATTPSDPGVAAVIGETAATGEPATRADTDDKDLHYSFVVQADSQTRLIIVVTLDATAEFDFFAHQRESAMRTSILLALGSIAFVSLVGGSLSVVLARTLTNRKKAEDALRDSELRYRTLAELSPVAIFRLDRQGANIYNNKRALELLGLSAPAAFGARLADRLHPDDRERVLGEWAQAMRMDARFHAEYRIVRPDGSTVWVLGEASAEHTAQHELIGYVATATDITERKHLEEALREEARRDRLTGVLNHAAIIETIAGLITSAPGERFAVAMIDIDGMKALNDSYGHPLGDLAIRAVTQALQVGEAIVGRYGGDEFVAVLPGAGRPAGDAYVREVAAALALAPLTDTDTGAHVSVAATIGFAVYPDEAQTVVDLIKLADSAMYAKRRRRLNSDKGRAAA